MSETRPASGNYELQQEFLYSEQARISAELFERGVTSRIVAVVPRKAGVVTDVSGVGQFDKLFVPGMGMVEDRGHRGNKERQLSLVAVIIDPELHSRSFSYFRLGNIGNDGILYPYPGVPPEDAESVLRAASELESLRADGVLPNLDFDLLRVNNPHTAIAAMPPAEQA